MNIIKSTMISAMLGVFPLGLTASMSSYADTQSDLIFSCAQACHNVIVSPSGWSLDGSSSGRTCSQKTVSGWLATIQDMGSKGGFNAIGSGGTTSFSAAADFLYGRQVICVPPTPVPPQCTLTVWGTTPNGCPNYIAECPTFTATATFTPTPTPTTVVSPTPTSTGPHTWYDYDYMGGRCFAKDHTIMDRKWCEQHGVKGGGNHPSLTGYDRHAHLDYPGQKP